jgi:hypothetical protein
MRYDGVVSIPEETGDFKSIRDGGCRPTGVVIGTGSPLYAFFPGVLSRFLSTFPTTVSGS